MKNKEAKYRVMGLILEGDTYDIEQVWYARTLKEAKQFAKDDSPRVPVVWKKSNLGYYFAPQESIEYGYRIDKVGTPEQENNILLSMMEV